MNMSLADLRTDYKLATLSENEVNADPIKQFTVWFDEALKANVLEPNAMSLSTVSKNGRPSSRIVLIKEIHETGFTWFTNYQSRKGHELADNQFAALLFFWKELERQVRIEGKVVKITPEESDHYYHSRPLGSRLGAIASHQSQPIDSADTLQHQLDAVIKQYGDHPVRPDNWGGYRLIPDHIEFWQGRPSRLHDRIAYNKQADGSWTKQRLQP